MIPNGLVLFMGFVSAEKWKALFPKIFHISMLRKEILKQQEYSAGIRMEDAWASLEKLSIASNLGSAFHNSTRSCMTILHYSFYGSCDVFLNQEFPPFAKLFQTSRVC